VPYQYSSDSRKLPDNPANGTESVSGCGDTAKGKFSKTNVRDEEIDNDEVRGENE
jgi:hypothetical protein